MAAYYFYRLSLSTGTESLGKADYIFDALTRGAVTVYRKDSYQFMNVQYLKVDSAYLIEGEIIKYKPIHEEHRINENNEVEPVTITNRILARIHFYIDTDTNIIAGEDNRVYIPNESFAARVSELFIKNTPESESEIEIAPITETYSFEQRLKEVSVIKKINIHLVPSNPHNNDIWKDIDARLKERNLTNYHEIQTNKKRGESIKVDDVTASKFAMSEDGYGVSNVLGKDLNGQNIRVSTTDTEMKSKQIVDSEQPAEEQVRKINEKISEISNRTPDNK